MPRNTPNRGGHISLSVTREAGYVAISVRDSGEGIPPEMLPRVFELFTQVDRHANRAQGGLGIGLALVKNLVEMHAGTVEGRSNGAGCGSEFVVRLPLPLSTESIRFPSNGGGDKTLMVKRRVLVVDDNRDAADSVAILLKLIGADVRVVYNGADALITSTSFQPDVVLLDIGMPGMDGHEVARRLRSEPWSQGMILIALTGWGQEEDRRRSETAGFNHHLIKPPEIETLKTLLLSLERTSS
jgi:CheY-like chemotaxis protein